MQLNKLNEQAKQLNLSAVTISKGLRYGMFDSLFLGQGIEFDSCREYSLNDDIRYIDWNLTARSGRPFIKLYKEEHDVTIFVIVDASASMHSFSEIGISYFEKAIELASLFLFAGQHLNCQVGGLVFAEEIKKFWMPKTGKDFVFSIIHSLQKFSSKENSGSDLNLAFDIAGKILDKHSLIIIISDFKIKNYAGKLSVLTKFHDVIALKIFSKFDRELPKAGLLPIYDTENKQSIFVNTLSKKNIQDYEKKFLQKIIAWENFCIDAGVLPCKISVKDNSVKVLNDFLLSAENKYEAINLFKRKQAQVI